MNVIFGFLILVGIALVVANLPRPAGRLDTCIRR